MTPDDIRAKRERRLSFVSQKYRGPYLKAWAGKSRHFAIKAFCMDCCGDDINAIRECTAPACPLWEFRPYGGERQPQQISPQPSKTKG